MIGAGGPSVRTRACNHLKRLGALCRRYLADWWGSWNVSWKRPS